MVKKLFVVVCAGFLAACTPGMFELLNRDTGDPFTEKPTVKSFIESNVIHISWSKDECADEFILKRADDSIAPVYKEIYRGRETSYTDTGREDGKLYLYKLAKKRGDKTFTDSDPVLGVGSLVTRDPHEENDEMGKAVYLSDTTLISNMYFYRSYQNISVSDTDWYYMDIPPGWQCTIVVNDANAPPGLNSHFMLYVKDRAFQQVLQNYEIEIKNYETTNLKCYFKLYPSESVYVANNMNMDGVGGAIVQYTIKIVQKGVML
jgi:hypothetical protein